MLSQQLTHRALIRYDSQIGHLYVPNLLMRQLHSEKPHYIRTNGQGFRSNIEYHKDKSKDELRFLFIGDSFTAGVGVTNQKRFSDIVSKSFDAQCYNFALSASGNDQQYLIYKNIASKYEHDVLVISPHIMDIYRNLLSSRVSIEGQTGQEIMVPKPHFVLENGLLKCKNVPVPISREIVTGRTNRHKVINPGKFISTLLSKHLPKIIKEKLKRFQSIQHQGYSNINDFRWQLAKELIVGIIEEAGDIPIILAPLPYHQVGMNPNYIPRFKEISESYDNVHFVDVLKKFKTIKNTDDLYFFKDAHYSEFGNYIVAKELIKEIKKYNFLQQSPDIITHSSPKKKGYFILGISAFYHDSAAALIKDGQIVAAAQEERFTRIKNDSSFPLKAINFCLEEAEINIEDLDSIVYYDNPFVTLERILTSQVSVYPEGESIWNDLVPKWVQTKMHIPEIIRSSLGYKGNINFALHHLSHAASAFYPSPFKKAAILTIDGVGEWATATIGFGENDNIKILKEMNFPHSVGLLYSAFTYYTGFKVNEGEYKLMGLAPYGDPIYVDLIKKEIVTIYADGSIKLNMKYFKFQSKLCMINRDFEDLLGGPARKNDENVSKRIRDVAKSIQVVIEEVVLKMARHAKELTGAENLCLAGGVALNCVANGKLVKEDIYKDIWIQPAGGDSGGALGAALALYYLKANKNQTDFQKESSRQGSSLLGPSFSDDEIKAHLDSFGYNYKCLASKERNKIIASHLSNGKIIGHFIGRMEFGPRALGARSILGDPRSETAQSVLNLKIKYRESFRPFAPSVLEEDASTFFNLDEKKSPYMLLVADVNDDIRIEQTENEGNDLIKIVNQKRSDLPAITHVDYSARVQSVNKDDHPIYYDLINEFKKITGYGVVINTSFNVNGEPIICTPKDAVRCFMKTEMDILVMNNFILYKEDQKPSELDKIEPVRKSQNKHKKKSKVDKDAQRIFKNYIPKLKEKMTELNNSILNDSHSNWADFKNNEFFISDYSLENLGPNDILNQWISTNSRRKKEFSPVLNEIIRLSKKHKLKSNEISGTVSNSVYEMF